MTQSQINEVAPRDSFQIEATFVFTADKILLINALSAAKLAGIEATSIVSLKTLPNCATPTNLWRPRPCCLSWYVMTHQGVVKAEKADRLYPIPEH
jgi:hypothetical protein